ncbi:hypothetical protein [Ornithinimicrobium sufpigmenti]|uniref:hypothetical protein n=1 Tax=Ornithinimicrobium sufpigmenti TaxID=2508882 RepID=UPI001035BE76|nr:MULTISPECIES: hypothetical protein [unclassified Ornithinimicrobium]
MALTYATETDVDNALTSDQQLPDNVARLLTVASRWVRHATRTAVYDTTSAGLPSDEDVAAAFRDATVEQVLVWHAAKVSPDAGSVGVTDRVVTSKSMRSVSVSYDAASATQAKTEAATLLCDASRMILADAGLLGGPVTAWG